MLGISPVDAGLKKALAKPKIAEPVASSQIWICPTKNATAISTCTAARSRSLPIITSCRGSRSAQTPPATRKITRVAEPTPSTMPRSVVVPWLSTANVTATGTIESPIAESVRPRKSRRNVRRRSGPSETPRSLTPRMIPRAEAGPASAPGSRSGDTAHEEEDHPAERRDHGQDEQPLDHDDRENDPGHHEGGQQEQQEQHARGLPASAGR